MPSYQTNWHHRIVCDALDRLVSGECARLMIFVPPRHGKSELVSRRLPAYAFGKNPDSQIIATSYSDDLASRMNRDVQRIIDTPEYAALFPETKLNASNVRNNAQGSYLRNSDMFEVVGRRGSYRSAGVGGGITGMGFDIGIIDDPIKNGKEAASKTLRDAHWEWYTTTFYTRREKGARILLNMTRWHEDDLAGRLLRQSREDPQADKWEVISLPAVAEEPLSAHDKRKVGEALWPDKYSLQDLETTKAGLGSQAWAALYQQRPRAMEGAILNSSKLRIVDFGNVPKLVGLCRRWDLAFSENDGADYVTGALMGIDEQGKIYILHMKRLRGRWTQSKPIIVETSMQDGVDAVVLIEANGTQLGYYQDVRDDPKMRSRYVFPDKPQGNKEMRASVWGSRLQDGLIYVVRGEWNSAFFDEMDVFPNGEHDDQIDAVSGGYAFLISNMFGKAEAAPGIW